MNQNWILNRTLDLYVVYSCSTRVPYGNRLIERMSSNTSIDPCSYQENNEEVSEPEQ